MESLGDERQQLLLDLISSLENPVTRERLHWELDYGENEQQYANVFGPRPRRSAMSLTIGDLVDRELIKLTTEGIVISASDAGS